VSKSPRLVGRVALLALVAANAPVLNAQGAVSGQVSIQERRGQTTTDLEHTVVYLVSPADSRLNADKTNTQIAMHSREFVPHVRVVTVGSTVEFPNEDPFRHNVFSNSSPGAFDLGLYGRGESKGATFAHAGVFSIFCNIHARMSAFVVAAGTPYFAQPSADGRFEIPNVRPGAYTLRVWHERGGEHAREIEVPSGGLADLHVQLDARGFKFVQHKNKFGQEYTATDRDRY
jgi:plastocyanin